MRAAVVAVEISGRARRLLWRGDTHRAARCRNPRGLVPACGSCHHPRPGGDEEKPMRSVVVAHRVSWILLLLVWAGVAHAAPDPREMSAREAFAAGRYQQARAR